MEENHYLLYYKFLDNTCSNEELSDLFQLFGTADHHVLRSLITEELRSAEDERPANVKEVMRLNIVHQLVKTEVGRRRTKLRTLAFKFSAAAAMIIAVISATLLWQQSGSRQAPKKAQVTPVIKPGEFQATLTLANGKKIILNRSMTATLAKLGPTTVNISPVNGVSYRGISNDQALKNTVNTLTTGRGEQSPYPLILADGSKVWLNAASSITFPTQFGGNERVVSVTGEAYFEVAHHKALPFKVITTRQEITVLGTHFNIKAYSDEYTISTTLLQGSVKIKDMTSGASGVLIPGQQSRLDRSSGQLAITQANIEEVVAWKNGFFMFNDQQIKSIMKSVSRWYNVDVEYQNFSNNDEKFGGTFSRSSNLTDILSSLQSLGHVHFKINKSKIIVSN